MQPRGWWDYVGVGTTGGEARPAGGPRTVVVAPTITVNATVSGRWEFVETR
jgi:hypothetical protein